MLEPAFTDEQIIDALKLTMGKVYIAAEKLGCDPSTIYKRAKLKREIRKTIKRFRGKLLDTSELALWKAVQTGEAWAVCFALKTQGKKRGYIERTEQDLRTNQRISIAVTVAEDSNWYGNENRLPAEGAEASDESADGPGEIQAGPVRPALGQNGNGAAGGA